MLDKISLFLACGVFLTLKIKPCIQLLSGDKASYTMLWHLLSMVCFPSYREKRGSQQREVGKKEGEKERKGENEMQRKTI